MLLIVLFNLFCLLLLYVLSFRAGVSNLFYTADRLRFGGGGWMGSLKQVYSFILLSAHVEVDSSLVSERICDVNAALENSFTFCMTAVKTFTGITIAQSLHVDFVISIGSPSWFKTEIFPVLRCNRKPPCICILNAGIHERGIKSVWCSCLKHVSVLVRASGVCENSAQVTNWVLFRFFFFLWF